MNDVIPLTVESVNVILPLMVAHTDALYQRSAHCKRINLLVYLYVLSKEINNWLLPVRCSSTVANTKFSWSFPESSVQKRCSIVVTIICLLSFCWTLQTAGCKSSFVQDTSLDFTQYL